jgi:acetylornithine/N-succinyldiaminopimelate aminotransferase
LTEHAATTSAEPASSLRPLPIDVVSIQSQVVYGRVGNNVAVPALQAQGLTVAAVPTVVLSNTPHYPTVHGGAVPTAWFEGYLRDLSARGALNQLQAILTGYLGSPEQAQALGCWIGQAIEAQPALHIVVDPVLGDHDHGEYVSPGMADAYRRHLLSLADGLTPNGFELAHLTGMAVNSVANVVAAARTLLTGRTQWVAVTSAAPDTWAHDEMQVVLVTRTQSDVIRHPRIDATPKGTGDLFCATLTGHWLNGAGLPQATAQACREVVRALWRTQQGQCAELLLPPMASRQDDRSSQASERVRQFIYQIEIKDFAMQSATSHLMRAYARQPVSFVRGSGARLWDEYDVEYLDAIAGVAVTSLGHAHPEIATVIAEQAGTLLHTSNVFRIDWQERLGERLCALTGMQRAFFCNSGAEANETALKLARLHGHRKQIANPKVVVMENGFHGRTIATLSATGNPAAQNGFGPLLPGFLHLPYDDIDAVRQAAEQSPDIVAVLIEPVQGEGGIRVASADYLRELRALCDRHGWLLMLDEIQTGMGRTGAWFGHQHAGITPDVMTMAKALGNGFPIGACLARGAAADLFSPGQHGSTFGGNPLACRVACTVLDIMARDEVPKRAAVLGARLLGSLKKALSGHPNVTAIRGLGLMVGIELDKSCKELVGRALAEQRLLITVTRDSVIRLLPPLICDEMQIDDIVVRVARLLSANHDLKPKNSKP